MYTRNSTNPTVPVKRGNVPVKRGNEAERVGRVKNEAERGLPNPNLPNRRLNRPSVHLERVEWTLVRVAEGMETEVAAEGMETEIQTTEDLNRMVSTLRIAIPSRMLGTLLLFSLCTLSKDVFICFSMLTFSFRCGG
jgi:hypothetical protein